MQDRSFPYPGFQESAMANEAIERSLAFAGKYIAPALPVIVVLGVLWGIFVYTVHSEIQTAISSMSGDVGIMKTQVSGLEAGQGKTNDRIDTLLKDALDRAWPKPSPTSTKTELKGDIERANEILRLAKAENIKLNATALADYGRQVTALSNDPHMSAVALKTIENLLEYRSFLNTALAPKPGDLVDDRGFKISQPQDFSIEMNEMSLPGNPNGQKLGWVAGGKIVRSNSPDAAMFLKIGDEGKTNASASNIYVEGTGFALDLDGYHIKNTVIHGAKIVYNGDPLILENVYFVNCTFEIRQAQHTQDFANAVMSHTPASFPIS